MRSLVGEGGYKPRTGVWELTLRCNLNCMHCGSSAGQSREAEMSLDEMLKVADDLVELGNRHLTLSGGEPLLFTDWPVVAKRLAAGGGTVNMISNGYAVSERSVDHALEAGLSNIGFSLDGDEAVHNKIRGRSDCYSRLMYAFDICAEKGLPTATVTHLNNLNLHQLDLMAQILIDHGVSTWQVQLGFDSGNLSSHRELLIEPTELKWIIPKLAKMKKELKGKIRLSAADDIGYYTQEERILRDTGHPIDFWVGCQAGIQVIGIEANGNIKGCLSMQTDRFVEGNVREESLKTIWFKEGNFAYTRNFKPENVGGFCRECQYLEFCRGGCSWKGYLHGNRSGTFSNRYCLYQVCQLEEAEQASAG